MSRRTASRWWSITWPISTLRDIARETSVFAPSWTGPWELRRKPAWLRSRTRCPGLLQRPDGNDVSMDREGLLLAETQMQFRIGIQFIRSEFHRLVTAINEGKDS